MLTFTNINIHIYKYGDLKIIDKKERKKKSIKIDRKL